MPTLLFVIAPTGCTVGGNAGQYLGSGTSAAAQSRSAGIDPARAYLSLDRIEPLPSKPARSGLVKPLSARAQRQIDKARQLIGQQRYTEAAIALERALRYDPNHPQIHRTLATLHWEAGNIERAKTHAARALEVKPDDATAHYVLGRYHTLAGDHAPAMLAYRTALLCSDIDRDLKIAALCHYYLAEALAGEGYLEAALAQYEAFETQEDAIDPDAARVEADTSFQLKQQSSGKAKAAIYEKLGRFAKAAEALEPLVDESPDDVALGSKYVRLLIGARRLEEALVTARRLPIHDRQVVELLLEVHRAAGHPERIIDDLRSRMTGGAEEPGLILHLAEMLMRLGRLEAAQKELQGYLDLHPGAEAIRAALVDALIAGNTWTDALRVCAEGIEQNPAAATERRCTSGLLALASNEQATEQLLETRVAEPQWAASYLRGVLAAAAGQLDKAQRWLRQTYQHRPMFIPARVALAGLYLRTYRYDEAIQVAVGAAEDSAEDARLELVLGEVYERLDDPGNAERHFQAAIQLDRSSASAMYALAKLYQRSGQRLQAQRQLRVLLEKDAGHEAARELLAFIYLDDGKLDVAVEQLEELKQRATTPLVKARCLAFLKQVHQQDANAYRQELLEAMEQHGSDADTWLAIAQSYDGDRQVELKHEAFGKALAVDPDNEEAAIGLVETARQLLAFEDAAQRLEALLRRRPNRHAWRLGFDQRRSRRVHRRPGLIEIYWVIQDYDAALALARNALTRNDLDDSTRQRYRLAILETLRQAHRDDEALAGLQKWVDAEPDNRMYSSLLAAEYVRQDQAPKAVPILEALHQSKPSWGILSSLLDVLVMIDNHDRASQYVLDRLSSDPGSDTALSRLASILADAGRFDDAIELARNRLLRTLDRQRFQTLMVLVLGQAEAYDEALDFVEALMDEVIALTRQDREPPRREVVRRPSDEQLAVLPNEPFTAQGLHNRWLQLRNLQAGLLLAAKRYHAAQRQLTTWLDEANDPDERFQYLRRLALCHRAQGDELQANDILARALLLRPSNFTLNNDVAYGWIDQGVRLDEAQRLIRYALSRSPRQGAYLDTYGWLMYKKGAFEDAKKWLLRANHVRGGDDPVILDHLGDTLWRVGEAQKAIKHWQAAVAATRERPEEAMISADERRVRDATTKKIDDARAGRPPAVAPPATE